MTLDELHDRIEQIRRAASDDEAAHAMEDQLRADVLRAIADGAEPAGLLARGALMTADIEFERWCA